jgi:putative ABC transport system permease protein
LLRVALFACPREFRREYGDEIAAELEDRSPAPAALAAMLVNIAWTGALLRAETLARDAGFAMRTLAKSPAFVIVSIAAIALAIGVNVAVGSLTEQILLHPVPYEHAERLVYVFSTLKGARSDETSYPDLVDLARRNRTFAVLSGATGVSGTLTGRGEPLSLRGAAITAGYFDVLGIKPEIGRLLGASDLGKRRIVISDDLWHKRFAADPFIAGKEATIDDVAYTIAGVAPPHASTPSPNGFLHEQDYWVALDPHAQFARARGWYAIETIGRLDPGASIAGANADLARIASDLAREYPGTNRERGVRVVSLADAIVGEETPILLLIQAGVFMVFLIAAANVGSLLLARDGARARDAHAHGAGCDALADCATGRR